MRVSGLEDASDLAGERVGGAPLPLRLQRQDALLLGRLGRARACAEVVLRARLLSASSHDLWAATLLLFLHRVMNRADDFTVLTPAQLGAQMLNTRRA